MLLPNAGSTTPISRPSSASGSKPSSSKFNLLAPSAAVSRVGGRSTARDDLTTHRFVLNDPPDVFPLNPDNFQPWKKSKQEDDLALDNVTKGYLYPPPVPKEHASAKAAMVPLLKQWTSLPALSFFLVSALTVKENTFKLHSPWTFRPPPRVTLTDHKREAWLRDLATGTVPLRKLSRTIPHGIRNKSLLEQCCTKGVPVNRAVWFAKCVGANELRGLKRKGSTGSDLAWVREWTEDLICFIEQSVSSFVNESRSSKGRKNDGSNNKTAAAVSTGASGGHATPTGNASGKMNYVCKLAVHLFHEGMVDQDLFLSWCIRYFAAADPVSLPLAVLLVKLFWQPLTQVPYRKKLALGLVMQYEALLTKVGAAHPTLTDIGTTAIAANSKSNGAPTSGATAAANTSTRATASSTTTTTNSASATIFSNLLQKIAQYACELLVQLPDSFVQPSHWATMDPVLSHMVEHFVPQFQCAVASMRMRNDPLVIKTLQGANGKSPSSSSSRSSSYQQQQGSSPSWPAVFHLLETLRAPYDLEKLFTALSAVEPDRDQIIRAVLTWCMHADRDSGTEYLYICVGLCRFAVNNLGWNITKPILSFLVSLSTPHVYCMDRVYDLVEEFIRCEYISPELYLRRLISSGVLFIKKRRSQIEGLILLLKNLPFLTKDLRIQRDALLYELGVATASPEAVDAVFNQAKTIVFEKLSCFGNHDNNNNNNNNNEAVFVPRHPYHLTAQETSVLCQLDKNSKQLLCDALVEYVDLYLTENCDRPISISSGVLALLETIFQYLGCYRAYYHILWQSIPFIRSMSSLYLLAVGLVNHARILCAFGRLDELVALMITQMTAIMPLQAAPPPSHLHNRQQPIAAIIPIIQYILPLIRSEKVKADLEAIASPFDTLSPVSDAPITAAASARKLNESTDEKSLESLVAGVGLACFSSSSSSSSADLVPTVLSHMVQLCGNDSPETIVGLRRCIQILHRLKYVESPDLFDSRFEAWAQENRFKDMDPSIAGLISSFCVIYGILSVDSVAKLTASDQDNNDNSSSTSLFLLLSPYVSPYIGIDEGLALQAYFHCLSRPKPETILQSIRDEISRGRAAGHLGQRTLESMETREFLVRTCHRDIYMFYSVLVEPLIQQADETVLGPLCRLLCCMLEISPIESDLRVHFDRLLDVYGEWNKQLCQVQFRASVELLKLQKGSSDLISLLVEVLFACASELNNNSPGNCEKSVAFRELVAALDIDTQRQLLLECEEKFLSSADFPLFAPEELNAVPFLLELFDGAAAAVADDTVLPAFWPTLMSGCVDKLVNICLPHQPPEHTPNLALAEPSSRADSLRRSDISAADNADAMEVDFQGFGEASVVDEDNITGRGPKEDITGTPTERASDSVFPLGGGGAAASSIDQDNSAVRLPDVTDLPMADIRPSSEQTAAESAIRLIVKMLMIHNKAAVLGAAKAATTGQLLRLVTSCLEKRWFDTAGLVCDALNVVTDSSFALPAVVRGGFAVMGSQRSSSDIFHTARRPMSHLAIFDPNSGLYSQLRPRPFDSLEEGNPAMGVNDAPIDLTLFDSSMEKTNPT